MPKSTFLNLPDEKRCQIIEIAIEEFANNDYDAVSISRIVARAGIAKGSFYQYFVDKDDLYAYLLGLLVEAKTQFMSLEHPDPQHIGIFAYLRWLMEMGVSFELAFPDLCRIGRRAVNAGGYPKAFDRQAREATLAFYRRLVEVGQQQGDIAPDIDPELVALLFDAVLSNLSKYMVERAAKEGIALAQDSRLIAELPVVRETFMHAINILQHGMRREAEQRSGTVLRRQIDGQSL